MKRVGCVLISLLFIVSWGFVTTSSKQNAKEELLLLQNVEALAVPEIIVGPFCMVTSSICVVKSDGLFLRGVPLF